MKNTCSSSYKQGRFCHIIAHAHAVLLVTYFHKLLTVIRSLFCKEQSVQYTVCLYKKTLLCVSVQPLKGSVCVLSLAVMVSINGGFMKLWFYKMSEKSQCCWCLWRTTVACFPPAPQIQFFLPETRICSLILTISHGVCHSLPARLVLLAGLPPPSSICSSYGRLLASRQTGMFGL